LFPRIKSIFLRKHLCVFPSIFKKIQTQLRSGFSGNETNLQTDIYESKQQQKEVVATSLFSGQCTPSAATMARN
jgi:hypothetical protein